MTTQDQASPEGLPGEKSKKYDRQLRLWGDHGQIALETAKVCLINASATGTEILKNLILPGVGSFTIVDGKKVAGEDVGCNFFLVREGIGKSRAQVATELLAELNDDVNGDFVEESVESLLDNNSHFFNNFNLVIATEVTERTLLRLGSVLYEAEVPLMICRSYGFVGYIRLVLHEHCVVESHPDSALEDLRLDRPLLTFEQFCDSLDLNIMTKKEHSHTPWLVILYKYLQIWKSQHGGDAPKNYKEKNQLKELIRNGIRRNSEGVPEDEENFDEAIRNLNTALVPTTVPSDVNNIFSEDSCQSLHSESKPFWILARAVKEFVDNEGQGCLPLRGSIPDMTADSERFIQLQTIYRDHAAQDVSVVTNYVQQLLQMLGRPSDSITDTDIRTFCKNASFLKVLRGRSLVQEYNPETANVESINMHLEDADNDDLVYYVLLRAVDRYYSEFSQYPGINSIESDIPKLKCHVNRLLQEWSCTQTIKDDFVHEFCRYGASELHSIASFIGGAAAHEVIKVITGQFVPINNTFIYNGMKQTSITLDL